MTWRRQKKQRGRTPGRQPGHSEGEMIYMLIGGMCMLFVVLVAWCLVAMDYGPLAKRDE